MDFKGSKTEQNLYRTFAQESRARTKYNLYAEKARIDGYQWVAEVFDETAHNELAHAREILSSFLYLIGCTKNNLLDGVLSETEEAANIYKKYEEEARTEGFNDIADFYKELIIAESAHGNRFKELYDMIENGTMFRGPENSLWICMNCGYISEGPEPPIICPLCKYPRAYYKPYNNLTMS
ncbi:rubrerythrin family protein [Clostridium sp. AL.422]|uniref:rubrerythrin family protein n=1 Tax=Clostridium TaxID=1485 RepID=UPI00293DE342|nr:MULTISPECIES: rubrerythrin family protein [unclassified Clostridium]MDV4151949.1 rubrerythrin family protein [Clostridium sp. AL.422]